jgi:peptidoglycan/LPS O-acetylase OafA/YrhL
MTATAQRVAPRKLGYQPSLDGLRAISVLAVILYHADFKMLPGGFLGVEVFFVVSGFLITSLLLEERLHKGQIDLKQFWIRRGRRLLPALYLLLAVVSAASILVYRDAAGRMGGDVLAALAYISNWWNIFLNESYFAQAGRPPLLRHLWSLAVEEQFYLIFPPIFALVLVKYGKSKARIGLVVVALASAIEMAILFEPYTDPSRVYYGTDTRIAGLLVGAVLALSWTPWRSTQRAARSAGPALDIVGVVGLGFIVLFLTRVNEFDPFIYRGGFLLLDIVCIIVIGVLVHPAARLSRVLAWSPLVWIGLRSYAIYLWHWPIFQVTRPELDLPFTGFPVFVLRMVLTLGAAELSYRYVEQPLRKGVVGSWWRDLHTSGGPRRALLVRRGITVSTTFLILLVFLTLGLRQASTSGERAKLELASLTGPGTEDKAEGADGTPTTEGSDTTTTEVGDATTTTTTTPATAATTVPGDTAAPTAEAPTATEADGTTNALAVGDSVMLGASGAISDALPGVRIDAKVARQFDTVVDVVRWYAQEGLIPGPLIVHAGTNGAFSDADLDELLDVAGDRKVLLVNAHVSRPWQDLVNERLATAVERHPNAVLVDWHGLSGQHPEWFVNDGAHLRAEGAQAFAQLIREHL